MQTLSSNWIISIAIDLTYQASQRKQIHQRWPARYQDIIVTAGAFHKCTCYMKLVAQRYCLTCVILLHSYSPAFHTTLTFVLWCKLIRKNAFVEMRWISRKMQYCRVTIPFLWYTDWSSGLIADYLNISFGRGLFFWWCWLFGERVRRMSCTIKLWSLGLFNQRIGWALFDFRKFQVRKALWPFSMQIHYNLKVWDWSMHIHFRSEYTKCIGFDCRLLLTTSSAEDIRRWTIE